MMIFVSPIKAQSILADTVYKVDVTRVSNNQTFQKCFRFDDTGGMKIDNTGEGKFGSRFFQDESDEWQAVITKTLIMGISGVATGSDFDDKPSNISGDAINDKGSAFTFQGEKDSACTPIQTVDGIDPFAD